MINKLKYTMLPVVFFLLAGCENEPILIPEDISYVAFTKSSLIISEDAGSADISLYYTTFSKERAEVNISVTTNDFPAT